MSRDRVKKNKNLSALLLEKQLAASEAEALELLEGRKVYVNGVMSSNPRMQVSQQAQVEIREPDKFVSRGGFKLEAALQAFQISPSGLVCADIGSSTGGFTDVLLQSGARKVYAIDSAYGELDWKLRSDPRVVVLEKTSISKLSGLPEEVQLVTIDVSLVPLATVLGYVRTWLPLSAQVIALLKPQYENGGAAALQKGVITDASVQKEILDTAKRDLRSLGFAVKADILSPLPGQSGNREYLLWLTLNSCVDKSGAA